jgi:hypothetical protein
MGKMGGMGKMGKMGRMGKEGRMGKGICLFPISFGVSSFLLSIFSFAFPDRLLKAWKKGEEAVSKAMRS